MDSQIDTSLDQTVAVARVRVLLATRNGAPYVERQIASVLAQTGVEVRIDVRDDGSTDGTMALVEGIAARDRRVRLSPDRKPSGSASANFFQLARRARLDDVDHIAFCDQDDEWWPGKLARAVDVLGRSGCKGYSSAVYALWPGNRSETLNQNPKPRQGDYLFEGAGQGCTFVFHADWFVMLQRQLDLIESLLPRFHYHDWLLYALTRASKGNWYFDPTPTINYRQHADNDTGARTSFAGIMRRIGRLRAGWYRAQIDAVVAALLTLQPIDPEAAKWAHLSDSRAGRLAFVLQHGRRRRSDRLIMAVAVLFGYL